MKASDIVKLMEQGYTDEEIDAMLAEQEHERKSKQTKRQDRQQRRKKKAREEQT